MCCAVILSSMQRYEPFTQDNGAVGMSTWDGFELFDDVTLLCSQECNNKTSSTFTVSQGLISVELPGVIISPGFVPRLESFIVQAKAKDKDHARTPGNK